MMDMPLPVPKIIFPFVDLLKTDIIKKELLNQKDYVFKDFKFMIRPYSKYPSATDCFEVWVYDFDTEILKLEIKNLLT
jgi:hypothetical protein